MGFQTVARVPGCYCPKAVIPRHISQLNADAPRHSSLALAIGKPSVCRTACGLGNNGKAENQPVSPFAAIQSGSILSLCLWMNGLEIMLPLDILHCRRHGKVIKDATLERQVSMSSSLASLSNRRRMRFLPMLHWVDSCSSEYCA